MPGSLKKDMLSLANFLLDLLQEGMKAKLKAQEEALHRLKHPQEPAAEGVLVCKHGVYECPECAKERNNLRQV